MNLLRFGAFAVCILSLAADADAVTYYVRTSGSDSHTGKSAAQAFKTIKKAATLVGAGDTVYVGAGTYTDQAVVSADGTSSNPIRFVADTTGSQTGDAGPVIVQKKQAFMIDGDDYIEIIGFEFDGEEKMVYFKDCIGGLVQYCEFRNGKSPVYIKGARVTIDNCYVHDNADEGILVEGSSSYITITNCSVLYNEKRGICIKDATQVVIEDTTSNDNGDHGIRLEADGCTAYVRRCTLQRNKDGFHSHGTHTLLLEYCVISDNEEEGIQMHAKDPVVVINHCTIVRNGKAGMEGNAGTTTVTNSIFAFNTDEGIKGNGTTTGDYNLLYGNATNYSGISPGGNDIQANPKFTSLAAGDFTLLSGSPAIDAASDMTNIGAFDGGPSIYYVRISGDDSNDGLSPSEAFQTISRAAGVVKEGDLVYVGGGTYLEGVVVQSQGTSSDPILFIADTTGVKTGDAGSVIVTAPVDLQYGWSIQNSAYISLDGFRISGEGMPQANGLLLESSLSITIKNCEIDSTIHGIYGMSSTLIFENLLVHDTTTCGLWLNNVTDADLQVTDLTLTDNGTYGLYIDTCDLSFDANKISDWAISGSPTTIAGVSSTLAFDSVTISGGTASGVQLAQSTLTATATIFSGCGYGLAVENSNVTLADCTVSGNTVGLYANQNPSLAVSNTTFTGNSLWGAAVYGGGTAGTATFDACTIHNNAGGLAVVDMTSGGLLLRTGTVIRDNTNSGLHFENCNLTVNDQAGGNAWRTLRNGNGISSTGSTLVLSNVSIEESSLYGVRCENSSVSLANCTVTGVGGVYADAANDNLTIESTRFDATNAGGWGVARNGGNLDVKNCVLNGFDGGVYLFTASGIDQAAVNNSTLVNLAVYGVYLNGGAATVQNTVLVGSDTAHGLSQVSGQLTHSHNLLDGFGTPFSGTSVDASELLKNPRFVDSANGDFRLAKGSPAINSGMDLSASVTVDILGNARPSHKVFEIGAYEYMQAGGSFRILNWQETR